MWRYGQGGTKPTLDEVIHEPVIRLVMERDHVAEEALLRIIDIARQHLGGWGGGSRPGPDRGAPHFSGRPSGPLSRLNSRPRWGRMGTSRLPGGSPLRRLLS